MIKEFLKRYRKKYVLKSILDLILTEIAIGSGILLFTSILIIPYYYLLPLLILPILFFSIPNLKQVAGQIEISYPQLKDKLRVALDLEEGEFRDEGYSLELIERFITEVKSTLTTCSPHPELKRASWVWGIRILSIVSLFLLGVLFPGLLRYNLNPSLKISISPPGGTFLPDTTISFTINVMGPIQPDQGRFVFRGKKKIEIPVRLQEGRGEVRLEIKEGKIQFLVLRNRSPEYELRIKPRPRLDSIISVVTFPPYTAIPKLRTKARLITAIQGSRVQITTFLTPNHKVTYYYNGKSHSKKWLRLTLSKDLTVRVRTDWGSEDSIRFIVLKDLAPSVVIFRPGSDIDLPRSMRLDLGVRTSDDFRVCDARLCIRIKDKEQIIKFPLQPAPEETIFYGWDLTNLNLLPGDTVHYSVVAHDDIQSGRSPTYRIFFPTLTQIYEEVEKGEEYLTKEIDWLSEEAGDRLKDLDRIREDLLRKRKLSWAEQQKIEKIVKGRKELVNRIEALKEKWGEILDRIANLHFIDEELVSRLEEVNQLLREIAPEQYSLAMDKLKEMAQQNPARFYQVLDRLLEDQRFLKESLDRTVELLKRLRDEEYLRKLKELADELVEKEKRAEEEIKAHSEEAKRLSGEIESEIGELKRKITFPPEGLRSTLEAIKGRLDTMDLDRLASSQSRAAEEERWEEAKLTAEELKRALSQIRNDLKAMYQQTIARRREEIRRRIERRITQLIKISEDQELVVKKMDLEAELAIRRNLTAIAESIIEDRKLSFHIPASVPLVLARSLSELDSIIEGYRYGLKIRQNPRTVLGRINRAAELLLIALMNLMKGGSPSGLDAFQQMLSSIAQKQMAIGQTLINLLPIPATGMSAELKQKLEALAKEQQALRRKVEQFAGYDEFARMLAREMKRIEEDLFRYRVDRRLIERQQKLIRRLLDYERSIRSDKAEKRRWAEVGEDIERESPLTEIRQHRDLLREMIMKELRSPYPSEYQHYIRRYYRLLLEAQ